MSRFGLRLTPHGHLVAEDQDDAPEMDRAVHARLAEAFAQSAGLAAYGDGDGLRIVCLHRQDRHQGGAEAVVESDLGRLCGWDRFTG
jgi:hypothetical protein